MGLEATLTWKSYENKLLLRGCNFATTTLVGGYVFVVGHTYYGRENIFIFSIATQTWKPFFRFRGRNSHISVLVDDKLYCIGGRRRFHDYAMQITEIDLIVGTERNVGNTVRLLKHSAAYVQERGQIVIYGNESFQVFGYNVDSKQVQQYRILGNYKPSISCASRQSTVVSNGDIYVCSRAGRPESLLNILKLGDLYTATWSTVKFGAGVPRLLWTEVGACVMNDAVVWFGGSFARGERGVYVYDTTTGDGEFISEGEPGTCTSSGPWPTDGVLSHAVSINSTMWLFGSSDARIFSLKFEP